MKQFLTFAFIVIAIMFDCSESIPAKSAKPKRATPATLCKFETCSVDLLEIYCSTAFALQVRNGYYGEVCCGADFLKNKCSTDGKFCVKTYRNVGDLVLRYNNADIEIPARAVHKEDADDWCKNKDEGGVAYWINV